MADSPRAHVSKWAGCALGSELLHAVPDVDVLLGAPVALVELGAKMVAPPLAALRTGEQADRPVRQNGRKVVAQAAAPLLRRAHLLAVPHEQLRCNERPVLHAMLANKPAQLVVFVHRPGPPFGSEVGQPLDGQNRRRLNLLRAGVGRRRRLAPLIPVRDAH